MKRKMIAGILMFGVLTLTACTSDEGGAASRINTASSGVEDVLKAGLEEEEKKTLSTPDPTSTPTPIPTPETPDPAENNDEPEESVVIPSSEGVDVDLTMLSSTMVYSEVYNMMYTPENYVGKVVKMNGQYSYYNDEASGMEYYACIIQDATACCAQGIEFIPDNPEACPEEGGEVTVVGVFDTYMEGEYMYCTLRNATIL